jgi:hypothetical protein
MKRFALLGALLAALTLMAAATASADDEHGHGNGHGNTFGPYDGTSPDSGTCGNDWAIDTFQRVFTVSRQNADGTYTVREDFVHGSFVTTAGPSPGACEDNPGGLITPGIKGKMHGYLVMTVTGTFNPNATCPAPCTGAGFIAAFFGPTATSTTTSYFFTYSSGDRRLCAHHWRNASPDRGGNAGDIATTCPTMPGDDDDHEGHDGD